LLSSKNIRVLYASPLNPQSETGKRTRL